MPTDRRRRLKELESVIASGFDQVVAVGRALLEIRDTGLYLELEPGLTFERYCKTRWSLPERTAYQRIDAALVHEATCAIAQPTPIQTEAVSRELAPLLRQGGQELVTAAWEKVSERFRGQQPPTAREVHSVLVEEGYRERVVGPSSGKVNRRVRLGQFGDKLIAAEKRLNWFATKELGDKPLTKRDQELAASYADKCAAMAKVLRALSEGEVPSE